MLPSPGEILIIGLVALLLIAGRYSYMKIQQGIAVYRRTTREELERDLREENDE